MYVTQDEEVLKAAQNEIKILKKLPAHENIAQYKDNYLETDFNNVYIVLEDAGKQTLHQLVSRSGALPI